MNLNRLIAAMLAAGALGAAMQACGATGADLLPPEQKHGEIAYLSGGIGEDEARLVEGMVGNYPLTLEFVVKARPRAEFTADVSVVIKDHAGKVVLDTVSAGAFLLVKLPAGDYTVMADQHGQIKTRHVRVIDKRPGRVIFEWNRAIAGSEQPQAQKG
jgi:hypothetical protein